MERRKFISDKFKFFKPIKRKQTLEKKDLESYLLELLKEEHSLPQIIQSICNKKINYNPSYDQLPIDVLHALNCLLEQNNIKSTEKKDKNNGILDYYQIIGE